MIEKYCKVLLAEGNCINRRKADPVYILSDFPTFFIPIKILRIKMVAIVSSALTPI